MTRKHFEAIARALRDAYPQPNAKTNETVWQWLKCRTCVADELALLAPGFDRARFLKACEPA